jgi:hypothetical protein
LGNDLKVLLPSLSFASTPAAFGFHEAFEEGVDRAPVDEEQEKQRECKEEKDTVLIRKSLRIQIPIVAMK